MYSPLLSTLHHHATHLYICIYFMSDIYGYEIELWKHNYVWPSLYIYRERERNLSKSTDHGTDIKLSTYGGSRYRELKYHCG